MPHFEHKVVVVTGASSGIGRALVLALAAQRPRLVLAARDAARLAEVAQACRAAGAQALVVPTDVTEPEQCRGLVDRTIAEYGAIDALVNNAGVGMIHRFDETTDLGKFEQLMRVNYLGYVYATFHALPHLKRSRGLIVAVSSLTGLAGVPTRTGYAASKHAVIGFFDSLRIELLDSGVGVTIVCPDFVVSEVHRRAFGPDGQPLGRTQMDESKVMSAEICARLMVRAMENRERLAVLSARGRVARWVRLVAPGLIDRLAHRVVRTGR